MTKYFRKNTNNTTSTSQGASFVRANMMIMDTCMVSIIISMARVMLNASLLIMEKKVNQAASACA